jgi:hypothetical protein
MKFQKLVLALGIAGLGVLQHTGSAQALEFVTNGGFEANGGFGSSPTGWTDNGGGWYVDNNPHTGTYNVTTGKGVGNDATLSQQLSNLVIGSSYTVTFWYDNPGSPNTPNQLIATIGSTQIADIENSTAATYQEFSGTYVANPTDGTNPTLTFKGANTNTFLYLDDVSVQGAAAVPFDFNPVVGLVVGVPLFLGMRTFKQRRVLPVK